MADTSPTAATSSGRSLGRDMRIAELVALYLAVPAAIAIFMPPRMMFPALFAFTALGLWLLARTPGFEWRELRQGTVRAGLVLGFGLATLAVCLAIIHWRYPGREFALLLGQPVLMAMIFLLYPILSALPQELIFRVLWFRRYAPLLPRGGAGLALNAAAFSFAHLMYWSLTVAAMTFAGGLVFALAYRRLGFSTALALHAVAGWAIFAAGLGILFYSGNVHRPF
jgi:CAAX protease family protein